MTNILTSDFRTYVRELISNEFGSVNKEEKGHLKKPEINQQRTSEAAKTNSNIRPKDK